MAPRRYHAQNLEPMSMTHYMAKWTLWSVKEREL